MSRLLDFLLIQFQKALLFNPIYLTLERFILILTEVVLMPLGISRTIKYREIYVFELTEPFNKQYIGITRIDLFVLRFPHNHFNHLFGLSIKKSFRFCYHFSAACRDCYFITSLDSPLSFYFKSKPVELPLSSLFSSPFLLSGFIIKHNLQFVKCFLITFS